MNRNRYDFVHTRPSRKQTVGVDLRLVIIASLVVAMLLIQVILVETYSHKKPVAQGVPVIPITTADPDVHVDPMPLILESAATEPVTTESPSFATTQVDEAMIAPPVEIITTKSPTRPVEQVDIQKLEAQLKELQDIQADEDEELEGREHLKNDIISAPPPLVSTTTTTTTATTTSNPTMSQQISANVVMDDPIRPTTVPLEQQQQQQQQPPPPIPQVQTVVVQSSSSSSHHHHRSSSSSSSQGHLSKSCKARRHLFKGYKSPPRIVYFVPASSSHHDKSDHLDPLWKQVFVDLGYQETQNPSLATFLMAKQSSESKIKDICGDSQLFNHIKSTRALTNPVSLSKAVAKYAPAARFFPEVAVYGGFSSSTSYSTKKSACSTFMSRTLDYLKLMAVERNRFVASYVEKHDKTVARLSLAGVKKVLDAYKKSGTCPHSDDTIVVQTFKNLLLLDGGRTICSLRVYIYIPTLRPLMVFMATKRTSVHCIPANRGELNIFGLSMNDTLAGKFISLRAFRDKLVGEGRFPNSQTASIALNELISKLKRAVGEIATSARSKLELLHGRFGVLGADFVLDGFSLQPILAKITDVPEVTMMDKQNPGAYHSLLVEVVRSQQHLAQRAWFGSTTIMRPENLRALSDFELCAYETPFGSDKKDKSGDIISASGVVIPADPTTWSIRVFPFS